MYFVVPVNVPASEPMSSPETPKSQSLTTPCPERRTFEGLISRWMTFLECKYARPCRTCEGPNQTKHTEKTEQTRNAPPRPTPVRPSLPRGPCAVESAPQSQQGSSPRTAPSSA